MNFINSQLFSISRLVFELARAKDGESIIVNDGVTSQPVKYEDRFEVIRHLSARIYVLSSRGGFEVNDSCKSPCHLTAMNILNLSNCEIGGAILIGGNKIAISSEEDRAKVLISLIKTEQYPEFPEW